METRGGATFLVQGAPGAGKTALLEEMALDAMEKRWDVVEINLEDLYNPVHMAQTLGKPYVARKQTAITADAKLLSAERIKEIAGDSSVSQVLENIVPRKGLLFILDEVQRVGRFSGTPNEIQVMTTLDKLHNGKFPHPTILLAAGLGMSKVSFGDLGISRFRGGCFVELGALGKESECAVIRDWIVKEGGATGDPAPWIDAIAQNTHGWPQHISAYGDAAAKQIQYDDGEMSSEGLQVVHRLGTERREAYYKQRAEKISRKERGSLARVMKNVSSGDGLDQEDIEAALSQEYDSDKSKDLFKRALERGILHSQDGAYTIPIPSMRTWLIANYARE
ncbi:MAG: ATP-binding protein [Rhodothermaceae bacterium]|nr:ATP-binding protein [Rhodothermaceae bacterium]MXZ18778.1 ATP-binding protein [Rhodothermaceae bacterium]MYE63266.1 ATP-binding protein [Rhodothermaceae bacterium]MYG70242.1 ATP-binding protein [Rhodothermaceae bacterium]MYJ19906.1 ATP-binding protein [Rhodothermaceae bacterium]